MREDMRDAARAPPVGGKRARRRRRVAIDARGPVGGRHLGSCRRAAPFRRACAAGSAPSPRTATKAAPTRCGLSVFGAAYRKQFGIAEPQRARSRRERAEHAARPLRRADRRAEIHHGLREIAGPCRPAPVVSTIARISRLASGSGVRCFEQPRRSPARHCRRPPRPAGRRRSPRSPPPYRRRCRATRAVPLRCRESVRQAGRRPMSAHFLRLRARE